MNSCNSVEEKRWSIGLVTAILDGECQMSKGHNLGYPCCCSSDSGAVLGPFGCVIQHTPAVIY